MHRNTRRFGAAVMAAGSLLILSACSAPQTSAPVVTKPAATAPAPATIIESTLVSGASTLENGSTYVSPPNVGETGTYIHGNLNLTINCSPKVWNEQTGEISTEVTVTNNGGDLEHAVLVIDALTEGVSLANPDATVNGKAYIYFGHLAAGATSQVRVLRFSSEAMIDYRCVTHIEARPACLDVCVTLEDLDELFAGIVCEEEVEARLHEQFAALLDTGLDLEARLALARYCFDNLELVEDVEVRQLLRLKLAECLYTGLSVQIETWLEGCEDVELKAKLRHFICEVLHLDADEFANVVAYLRLRFEAECLAGIGDAELSSELQVGFEELLDFCEAQFLSFD